MRVVPLEMSAPLQAAVVSCSEVNLGAQSTLSYLFGFSKDLWQVCRPEE